MTWTCQHCNTLIDDNDFEVCWNCSCEKGQAAPHSPSHQAIRCLRCDVTMKKLGSREFHQGSRFGVFGNLGELLVDKQALDMLACSNCGKVEFFLPDTD